MLYEVITGTCWSMRKLLKARAAPRMIMMLPTMTTVLPIIVGI